MLPQLHGLRWLLLPCDASMWPVCLHLVLLQAFISLGKLNARNARPIGSEALQELLRDAHEGFDLHTSSGGRFGGLTL